MCRIRILRNGTFYQNKCNSKVTTGAQNDLQKVSQMATAMVMKLGMNDEIGYVAFKEG